MSRPGVDSGPNLRTGEAGAVAERFEASSKLLAESLIGDRRRLGKGLKKLRRQFARLAPDSAVPAAIVSRLARLHAALERSATVRRRRSSTAGRIEFPPDLPISAHVEALGALLAAHQVVIVSGETGSGKSTQLPKLCLAAGRGVGGRIGHTQPRRIAARAIARRIAEETATVPGELVGHCVRFDDNLAAHTRLKVMTDGILLNEIHTDPWLEQYDTIIIDEVHERSLNIDVLLGYLKRVLARRADLKLIITSATLDIDIFSSFYEGSATYTIPGRSYPVELRYRPFDDKDDGGDGDVNDAIVGAIQELDDAERGDVLVFLPGEREIREASTAIERARFADTQVLKLYARLGPARQARIFQPTSMRRIILSTNVAETSLTVPRVKHVIDTGMARISRYSPRRKLQQLPIEKIARANADQRLGRCGREAPGTCVRLYSEDDFAARRSAVEPEIQRTNLAGVILRLKALGISDIENFPFAERPAERLIKDGYSVLQEIRALDHAREITAIGARLYTYPVDPRLARVLTSAAELGCLREGLIIAAALSIADPRERPHEVRDLADRAHGEFSDKRSDFMWFVNAWDLARELAGIPFKRRLRRCRRLFLSAVRLQEWVQLHDYLAARVVRDGLQVNEQPASYKSIHCALAAGFPSLVGEWQTDRYQGCRNTSFALHPASILHRREVKWILASEIVETARPYARLAARIDAQWIDRMAGHLVKRNYEAPRWDRRRGCAVVTEIQRLFGLVIEANREVELGRIDAPAARALFIESGLLEGDLGETPDFLRHNLELVERIQDLEARARRRDLCAPRTRLHAFYHERIPPAVHTRRALLRWQRSKTAASACMYMDESDATSESLTSVPAYLFPDTLDIAGTACGLTYRFEPGQEDDGISVSVPLVLLARLREEHFDRLVPGLLSEKIEGLLRALPKAVRRQFSPIREYAMAAVAAVADRDGPLKDALASVLTAMTGHAVDAQLFDDADLEAHLRCLIELVDDDGAVLCRGRDLERLKQGNAAAARDGRDALRWGLSGSSIGGWTFGSVPAEIAVRSGGNTVLGYPALIDRENAVELHVFDSAAAAMRAHGDGVVRLVLLSSARQLKRLERGDAEDAEDADGILQAVLFGFRGSPHRRFAEAFARRLVAEREAVRDADSFSDLLDEFRTGVAVQTRTGLARLMVLFSRGAAVRRVLDEKAAEIPVAARTDIVSQLNALLGPAVISAIDRDGGARHDRYLDAIERRLSRLTANPGKDLRKLAEFAPLWQKFVVMHDPDQREANALHGLFEEYRMTLFAPELGAAVKVSARQIRSHLEALQNG